MLSKNSVPPFAFFSAVFLYAFICHLFILFVPWQLDFYEGALLLQVHGQIHGVPVYSMAELPLYTNAYGSLYNSVGVFVTHLTHEGFFPLRLISFLSILSGLYLLNDILRRRNVAALVRLVLCLHVYIGMLFFGTAIARPDSLAFLLYVLCFWLFEVFDDAAWSLLLIVVLSLVGFLTKQYILIAAPLVISYVFFFRSKIKGLIFTAVFFLLLIATYKIDGHFLPGYLPMTVAVLTGQSASITLQSTLYMLRQTVEFSLCYLGAFLICAIYRKAGGHSSENNVRTVSLSAYAGLLVLVLLTLKLGHHNGAHLTYYFQLLGPFLVVAVAPVGPSNTRNASGLSTGLLCLACLATLIFVAKAVRNPVQMLSMGRGFAQVAQDIQPYPRVLASPMLVSTLIAQNKAVYYSGMGVFFVTGASPRALHLPGATLAPSDFLTLEQADEDRLSRMIATQQFNLIVVENDDRFTDEEIALIHTRYRIKTIRQIGKLTETEWVPQGS